VRVRTVEADPREELDRETRGRQGEIEAGSGECGHRVMTFSGVGAIVECRYIHQKEWSDDPSQFEYPYTLAM